MLPGYRPDNKVGSEHNEQHQSLFKNLWPIISQIATTAPTRNTLAVGYAQVYQSGATVRIYLNLNNVIYYWALTAA